MISQRALRITQVFVTALGALICSVAPGQTVDTHTQIKPVDQAVGHPQLEAVRSQLIKAAKAHDIAAIQKLTAPNVKGCGWSGFAGLQSFFAMKVPAYDPWEDFGKSLSLGGILQSPTEFSSNYVVWEFPNRNLEPELYLVAIGEYVELRERPGDNERVLARLSYNAVEPLEKARRGWQKVKFGEATGYVRSSQLASPIGLTVTLEKQHGTWRVISVASYCE